MNRGLLNVTLNTHLDLLYFNNDKTQLQECLNIFFNEGVINYTLAKESNRTRIINEIINNNEDVVNKDLYEAFSNNLKKGVSRVLNSPNKEDKYFDLQNKLLKNVDTFAAYKAYHCTQMIKRQVADGDGVVRTKKEIEENANKVLKIFNRWQSAEYNTAVARTRTGKQFSIFNEPDNLNTHKNIRWIPSRSVKQRDVHKPFYNLVLPKDDPFWQSNQPGNLWNCKCDWEQTSDPASAEVPKTNIQSKGLEGNPATTGEIFTNNASYISKCTDVQKQQVESWLKNYSKIKDKEKNKEPYHSKDRRDQESVVLASELTKYIEELNKDTGWFKNGFKKIRETVKADVNGSTDRKGEIFLKKNILKECVAAFENMKKGTSLTYENEKALATLWHEITHNRHKNLSENESSGDELSSSRKYMELANEFVARKTLPEFYKSLGIDMQYKEFMNSRDNTDYNNRVVKYIGIINNFDLNTETVLNEVRDYLFTQNYNSQIKGLTNGLLVAKSEKIKKETGKQIAKKEIKEFETEIKRMIRECL